jgi:LPXTG-motif cell wall-anchored protein
VVDTFLSIAMLAAFALAGGGGWLIFKRRDLKRGVLMLIAAVVLLGNVLILTWPGAGPQPNAARPAPKPHPAHPE